MKNPRIEALQLMKQGIDILIALEEETKVEVSPNSEAEETISVEDLNGMTYQKLKATAKTLGISAVGSREELTERIVLSLDGVNDEESTEEEEEEVPKAPTKKSKKSKVTKPEPEEDDEDEDEEEDEADEADVYEQVLALTEDMENEEIVSLLVDCGVKVSGKLKREALINKIVTAVNDGLIDFSDEEDEDQQDEEDEETSEEDAVNDIANPDMTEERRKAMLEFNEDTREQFADKELKRKELVAWLNEYHGTKDKMTKRTDEEILSEYIECSWLFIDDDGNLPEEGEPYYVNEEPYCCGKPLKLVDETYVCEACGGEFDAE